VLERMDAPLGVVTGIFGLQRHVVRFRGAHAHAGSTPMDQRRDAFLAAARSSLEFREGAVRRPDTRATVGAVSVSPGIVTAFNGLCELTLDQRALDADTVAEMVDEAREASARIAAEEGCEVDWAPQFAQAPVAFDAELVEIAAGVLRELTGDAPRLPSGPLHDAAEMARVVPAVMLFVRSIGGVSHTKDEDTAIPDLELSVRALHELTLRTIERGPWTSA
jgi:acetylornithine deacetylase/succinyl-diaminopimelate desuccinylase-like protein